MVLPHNQCSYENGPQLKGELHIHSINTAGKESLVHPEYEIRCENSPWNMQALWGD